ncbi:1,4-dihydroxy-2-naphthoate prenyltransferase [Jinshanibacter sp. LJY008]|uniref:1,4-dihydroxy-2-naphthoate prenyltransferase n=1 Tax=Limnobaculum eriocheiris TaxID=2897391 RepID=A0A9X1MW79_9GAMM|nr:1,4-dihydroxy-2-naphthoate prenyltransferase [Limnobaculum eriocheiris]MCD1124872.1 1,4-dihydroxy-2-naphthoate prenyltransferase [Limnobaculum eriocheiris]
MLRRISWILGALSLLIPFALYLWPWSQHQKLLASGLAGDELGWTLSVVLVDVFVAGFIAFIALLVNAISLYRLPEGEEFNPVVRIIELVLLGLPLLACLFFMGVSMMH